jgi:signal transduction histidine kinase
VAASLTREQRSVAQAIPAEAPDPVNILLVDDTPSRLLAYRTVLEDLNENLFEARSGTEALQLLMQHEFALILLDINMPGIDGFETAHLIHEHPRFEDVPIIFVTAVNITEMDRMRGYKLGAVDYVMVPIVPEILRGKVVVLAELYRKRRELEIANRRLASANEALQAEKTRELAVLNESLRLTNIELASRFMQLQAEVSERQRVEDRLIEQDQRKDEFLATLAHELRNPLSSVANAISVLKITEPEHEDLPKLMSRQVSLLVRLIDDLLDVARISQGKMALKRAPATLNAIIDASLEIVAPLLEAGRHGVNVQRLAEDVTLQADGQRLAQVFSNLLSNAAKYSDDGAPIEVIATRNEASLDMAFVDCGIGLDEKQRDSIFEMFAQVDTALERSRGGLGIGLTLARHIVDLHGGQLTVQSGGLGAGACFTVSLPLELIASAPAIAPLPPEPDATAPRRVLVVDDNADAAATLGTILQLLGHAAHCLNDPLEVVETVEAFAPEIVFLDIGMPGLNGYDVARALRAHPAGRSLTLVALTGWGQIEDRKRTAEAGFDYHVVKPADLETIQRICNGDFVTAAVAPKLPML